MKVSLWDKLPLFTHFGCWIFRGSWSELYQSPLTWTGDKLFTDKQSVWSGMNATHYRIQWSLDLCIKCLPFFGPSSNNLFLFFLWQWIKQSCFVIFKFHDKGLLYDETRLSKIFPFHENTANTKNIHLWQRKGSVLMTRHKLVQSQTIKKSVIIVFMVLRLLRALWLKKSITCNDFNLIPWTHVVWANEEIFTFWLYEWLFTFLVVDTLICGRFRTCFIVYYLVL